MTYSYHFICVMIDHYQYLLKTAQSLSQKQVARQGLKMYQMKHQEYLN
jgi:hypothetical protein